MQQEIDHTKTIAKAEDFVDSQKTYEGDCEKARPLRKYFIINVLACTWILN